MDAPPPDPVLGQARRAAARDAGSAEKSRSYLMSSPHVLADGEDRYSDPVKNSVGHIALSALILGAENPAFRAALSPEEAAAVEVGKRTCVCSPGVT
ncbi:hypothetical protein ABZ752_00205 [Streptomyces roseifaciens]